MNERDQLRESIRGYINRYWKYNLGDDELERYLSGIMAFIAVQVWGQPFVPFEPTPIIEEKDHETT